MSESKRKKAEESIRGAFHKSLFEPFTKACRDYDLICDGDKIAVCISGGKDSFLLALLLSEIQRHKRADFDLVFMAMDPGYSKENRLKIRRNCEELEIPVGIFESDIFEEIKDREKDVCYRCARMRRGCLYKHARESGCNKIALGHHFDDVIETSLMSLLYGGQIRTMMPRLKSRNYEGMELIRPMYLIREADICAWRDLNGLEFLDCACRVTEKKDSSKRKEIKDLISELKKTNPAVEANIFRSMENVDLDKVLAYKSKGIRKSFLDDLQGGAEDEI